MEQRAGAAPGHDGGDEHCQIIGSEAQVGALCLFPL
jgi:hypothetical protein